MCTLSVGGGAGSSNGTRAAAGPGSPLAVKRDVSIHTQTYPSLPPPTINLVHHVLHVYSVAKSEWMALFLPPHSLPLSTPPTSTLCWWPQSSRWREQSRQRSSRTRSTSSSTTFPPPTSQRRSAAPLTTTAANTHTGTEGKMYQKTKVY